MAQSQNTKVEYVDKASFLNVLTKTGQVMAGSRAFEFTMTTTPRTTSRSPGMR